MTEANLAISQLEILGSTGEPLANRYLRQRSPTETLAVVFPGLRYSCDKPLLYYTSQTLVARGVDVIQAWVDYNQPDLKSLSQTDLTLRMVSEAQLILQAGIQAHQYQSLILAGKSIGTLIMAFILSQEPPLKIASTIWLTPLLQIPFVTTTINNTTTPALVVGGTADPTFDPPSVTLLERLPNLSLLSVEAANHSLEIPADPRRSLGALSSLVDCLLAMAF